MSTHTDYVESYRGHHIHLHFHQSDRQWHAKVRGIPVHIGPEPSYEGALARAKGFIDRGVGDAKEEAAECGCAHSHPESVPSSPCDKPGSSGGAAAGVVTKTTTVTGAVAGEDKDSIAVLYDQAAGKKKRKSRSETPCERKYSECLGHAGKHVRTPREAYDMLHAELTPKGQEVFIVIATSIRGEVLKVAEIARGERARVGVSLATMMKVVLDAKAGAFVIVHNHPSGNPTPSPSDKELTRRAIDAAKPYGREITFVDHVIIGKKKYYSFRQNKIHKV